MGVQLGFMGVQLDGKVIGAGLRAVRELPAVAGGCRRAFLRMEPRDAATAVRPWHGAPSRPAAFVVSAGHTLGLRSRVALPPPLAGEMPARQALGCVSLAW
jgi:hypothetical protein